MVTKRATSNEVSSIRLETLEIRIIAHGGPLVTHCFSQKTTDKLQRIHEGIIGSREKTPKVPTDEFLGALHIFPGCTPILHDENPECIWAEGDFGFPAVGVKAAMVRAATDAGMRMTDSQRAFHILQDLCKIECTPGPYMRRDIVRVAMDAPDVRFRPQFDNWSMNFPVTYNTGVFTREKILTLCRLAGFGVGLGEWRPERGGTWGGFRVDSFHITGTEEF